MRCGHPRSTAGQRADGIRWPLQVLAYFSPRDHNHPKTVEELYKWNDVELFDLAEDPSEMKNLAANQEANRELIATMNAKLEAVIKAEIGVDDGRELPDIPLVNWAIDRVDA